MDSSSEPRKWAYGLTADEWFHLASEGEDSEIAPCCGNIGEIRDALRDLMKFQSPEDSGWRISIGRRLESAVDIDGNGHGLDDVKLFPLLHKVLAGIDAERIRGPYPCDACASGNCSKCTRDPGKSFCTCKNAGVHPLGTEQ